MSELKMTADIAIDEVARLRAENEQLREQVRARPDQEAIDIALSRAVLAERELASLRAENERLTKRIDLFYEQNDVIEQQLGIEADSVTKTIVGEIERLQSDLTALRRPVEHSAEVETIRARYVDDFRALASDGSIVKELNCWQDVANIQTLLSALDTTARQLRERVEMLEAAKGSYIVQGFWSPCRKYIASVHISHSQITVQDDNGDVWEPAGPAQDMAKVTP